MKTILDQIAERAQKATKGPWNATKSNTIVSKHAEWPIAGVAGQAGETEPSTNATFIANARSDIDKLVEVAAASLHAQCGCTIKERLSGHKTDCWFPRLEEALAPLLLPAEEEKK